MNDILETLAQLSVLVFVISSMLSMGLSLTIKQIVAPLRNARSPGERSHPVEESAAPRGRDGLVPVGGVEPPHDLGDVALDRASGDEQLVGDVGVGGPGGQQCEHFGLTRREAGSVVTSRL